MLLSAREIQSPRLVSELHFAAQPVEVKEGDMPQVKLLRSIGLRDCRTLELDSTKAKEGETISVNQAQYEEMVRCGMVEVVEGAKNPNPPQAPPSPAKHTKQS